MPAEELHGHLVGRLTAEGMLISTGADSSDLFGNAAFERLDVLAVPLSRFPADFFDLSTGYAGEILQKSVNYRVRVALIGEVSAHIQTSGAFAAFVRESNRGDQVWFLPDHAALDAKLAARAARAYGTHPTAGDAEPH